MTKEELLRKRNIALSAENKELKAKLAQYEEMLQQVNQGTDEIEKAKTELAKALDVAYEMQDKYHKLLKEMQNFKKTVKGRNAIERWVFDLKKK